LNNYILPDVYIETGLQSKRPVLESFSTLFLSFELTANDIEEGKKVIYLESISEMKLYSCLKEEMFLTQAISAYFENGGKQLYLMPQIEERETLFDNSKYIHFLATQLDYMLDIEAIVAVDIFLTEKFLLSDIKIQNIQNSISTYCKSTNRLSLMDLPPDGNPIKYAESLYYTIVFYPWIIHQSEKRLPASIYASALLSKLSVKNQLSYSIANITLKHVIDTDRMVNRDYASELYKESINPIIYVQNDGYKLWGIRTLADNIETINVLRLFFFIKRNLYLLTKEYIFEANDAVLEEKIVRRVRKFLFDLWKKGGLQGASKEEAFLVSVEQRLESELILKVSVSIIKPLEYIVIHLNRTTSSDLPSTLKFL